MREYQFYDVYEGKSILLTYNPVPEARVAVLCPCKLISCYHIVQCLWHDGVLAYPIYNPVPQDPVSRWRHQMKTYSALLALFEVNPPVTGGFPSQMPVTMSFDVLFDWLPKKRLKNSRDAGDLRRHRAHNNFTVLWHHIDSAIYWPCEQSPADIMI